jgi:hypothetical protein
MALAELFRASVSGARVADYVPELLEPEASTAGGLRAKQSVRLQHPGGGPALVVGAVTPPESTARLRSYACVESMHYARFGCAPPFNQKDYEGFLQSANVMFASLGFDVSEMHEVELPPPVASHRALDDGEELVAKRQRKGAWVAAIICGLAALCTVAAALTLVK